MARVFEFNGVNLPDPDPTLSTDDVKKIYAISYPEIATANVSGPTNSGDDKVFKFGRAIGTKG